MLDSIEKHRGGTEQTPEHASQNPDVITSYTNDGANDPESLALRKEYTDMRIKLAQKMGTVVEDLIYREYHHIIEKWFGVFISTIILEPTSRLKDGREKTYDLFAYSQDKLFLNTMLDRLNLGDTKEFLQDIREYREFFPEYADKKIIGVMAGIEMHESFLDEAEKEGFLVLAMGIDCMEVQNRPGFKAKEF